MPHRRISAALVALAALSGCAYPIGGDCTPYPVDLPAGERPEDPAVVLASSCLPAVRVDGSDTWYIGQGEWVLTEDAVAGLHKVGHITHVNEAFAPNLLSAADLVVWAIAGYDPGLSLWGTAWGTAANLRGTKTYVLWTINDCSEVDACQPPVCEFLDPAAPSTQERCGTQQS